MRERTSAVLPYILFLAAMMVALGVIGTTISGMGILTIVACICLALTVIVGIWTLSRRRGSL